VVLAFTDIPAGDAFRHSLRVIRDEWPASAWYVFAAPLTVQLVAVIFPSGSLMVVVRCALAVASAIVRLVCVGAVALFYADRYVDIEIPNAE
jgi:hypothetical protein